MTEQKQKVAIAKLLPTILTIYNEDNKQGICWGDTDKAVSFREWCYVLNLVEGLIMSQCKESNYWFQLRQILDFPEAESDWCHYYFISAVAASEEVRREAVLKALDLWED